MLTVLRVTDTLQYKANSSNGNIQFLFGKAIKFKRRVQQFLFPRKIPYNYQHPSVYTI